MFTPLFACSVPQSNQSQSFHKEKKYKVLPMLSHSLPSLILHPFCTLLFSLIFSSSVPYLFPTFGERTFGETTFGKQTGHHIIAYTCLSWASSFAHIWRDRDGRRRRVGFAGGWGVRPPTTTAWHCGRAPGSAVREWLTPPLVFWQIQPCVDVEGIGTLKFIFDSPPIKRILFDRGIATD